MRMFSVPIGKEEYSFHIVSPDRLDGKAVIDHEQRVIWFSSDVAPSEFPYLCALAAAKAATDRQPRPVPVLTRRLPVPT